MGEVIGKILKGLVYLYYFVVIYYAGITFVVEKYHISYRLVLSAIFLFHVVNIIEGKERNTLRTLCSLIVMYTAMYFLLPLPVVVGFFIVYISLYDEIIDEWASLIVCVMISISLLWGNLPQFYLVLVAATFIAGVYRLALISLINHYLGKQLVDIDERFASGFYQHKPEAAFDFFLRHVNKKLFWLGKLTHLIMYTVNEATGKFSIVTSYQEIRKLSFNEEEGKFCIDSSLVERAWSYQVVASSDTFHFLVVGTSSGILFVVKVFLSKYLSKIAYSYREESEIRSQLTAIKNEYKENLGYLLYCRVFAHDMRNSLGSVKNHISWSRKIQKDYAGVLPEKYRPYYLKELSSAIRSVERITGKINNILDRYDDLSASTVIEYRCEELCKIVQLECADWAANVVVEGAWKGCSGYVNMIGFEVVLTNIFMNLNKHSIGNNCVEFSEKADVLVLTVRNSYDEKTSDIKRRIKILQEDAKREIHMRNTSHGLPLIRAFLDGMNMRYRATASKGKFRLTIEIPKENTCEL